LKKRKGKRLYTWLTNKYQLIIRNEEDFSEKITFTFTYARAFLMFFLFFMITLILALFLGRYLVPSWYDADRKYNKIQNEVVKYSEAVDSLEHEVNVRDEQFDLLMKVFRMDSSADILDTTSTPEAREAERDLR
jgi:hypothetical protein